MAARDAQWPRDFLYGMMAIDAGLVHRDDVIAALRAAACGGDGPDTGPLRAALGLDGGADAEVRRRVEQHLGPAGRETLPDLDDRTDLPPAPGSTAPEGRDSSGWWARPPGTEADGPPPPTASAADPGGTVDDPDLTWRLAPVVSRAGERFRILRHHRNGNLGVVSVAFDAELGREVALKQIRDDRADRAGLREQFVREAELTGNLEHPGIVPVYSLGADARGRPYYAMRLIRGETFGEAIALHHARRQQAGAAVAFRELLRRFLVVCEAIAYAHARGVIHRDLKPENVLLSRFGETLVADWGLAKALGEAEPADGGDAEPPVPPRTSGEYASRPGLKKGTPAYMSPEQADGDLQRVGKPSDVFNLGAMLYHLLTGRAPYRGDSIPAVLVAARDLAFTPPLELDRSIPRGLEAICLKAMARRPEDRYGSASALADDLKRWMADEPVAALPEGWPERLARWSRRNRARTQWAAAALVLVSVVSTVAAAWIGRAWAEAERLETLAVQALVREQEAHREADANFDRARAAVDEVLARAAARDLADVPQAEGLRRELAGRTLGFYRAFLAARPGDPEVCRGVAAAFREVANLNRLAGADAPCGPHYDQAVALLERLVAGPAADRETRLKLAGTLTDRGEWHRMNDRYAPAVAEYRRALEHVAPIRRNEPRAEDALRFEGGARLDLSQALYRTGQVAAALDEAERASELLGGLVGDGRTAAADDVVLLVFAHAARSESLAELGRAGPALEAAEEVRARAEALAARAGGDNVALARGVAALVRADRLAAVPARRPEAIAAYTEGARLVASLFNSHNAIPSYRRFLAEAFAQRGAALFAAARPEFAAADLAQAAALIAPLADGPAARAGDHGLVAQVLTSQAWLARSQGREAEARALRARASAALALALAINPEDPAEHRRAGRLREPWPPPGPP